MILTILQKQTRNHTSLAEQLAQARSTATSGYCHETALAHDALWVEPEIDYKTGANLRISRKIDINDIWRR